MPVDKDEMEAFLGILMLIGITQRSSYSLYWSVDPLIEMPGFRNIMSCDRFFLITSFFHLANNDDTLPRDNESYDRFHKIRPFMNLLLPSWQRHYGLYKDVAIHESTITFNNPACNMVQSMPPKCDKWTLKAWVLVGARFGYVYNWNIYIRRGCFCCI